MLHRDLLFLLIVPALLPGTALADKIGSPQQMELGELPLRAEVEHLTLVTMREPHTAPGPEDANSTTAAPELDAVEGAAPAEASTPAPPAEEEEERILVESAEMYTSPPGSMQLGPGPWLYFDGAFAEGGCSHPRLSEDGFAALAICAGLDDKNPRAEHVVIRRGYAIFRYPVPVSAGAIADLSSDGERFAVLVDEGGSRTVHLIDMMARQDHRVVGGWREPGNPVVAGEADAVAFVAQVGGKDGAVLAKLGEEPGAWRAFRGGSGVHVRELTNDGGRVLVSAKLVDLTSLYLVDPARGVAFDLSGRKGDVRGADLHGSGDAAVFSSSIGGVCAIWWVDMTTRRRKDMFSSVDGCYERVMMDYGRRFVVYEESANGVPPTHMYDRKDREVRTTVPKGCADTEITGSGAFLAVRCTRRTGSALFLLPVPEESESK